MEEKYQENSMKKEVFRILWKKQMSTCQRIKLGSCLNLYIKPNSILSKYLNIIAKTKLKTVTHTYNPSTQKAKASQAVVLKSKPESSTPPWPCLSSCLQVPGLTSFNNKQWCSSVSKINSFPPQVAFGHTIGFVLTAIVTLTKTVPVCTDTSALRGYKNVTRSPQAGVTASVSCLPACRGR